MIGWIVLLVLLFLAILFTEELYRYLFYYKNAVTFGKIFDTKGHVDEYYVYRKKAAEKMRSLPQQVFQMQSPRGEILKGFFYSNGAEGKKIAILLPGHRSDHADSGGMIYDYFASRGFDVLGLDHTAAGESGGHFIGFDVFESQDTLKWIDFLKEKFGESIQIVVYGFSMGGATVMQMSSRCPSNVKFLVEDSGFQNAYSAMHHSIGPMYTPMRLLNRLLAGYDWNDSDVTESLQKAAVPMLFIHGTEDKLVPASDGPKLFALYNGPKAGFFPPKTRHIECMFTCPEETAKQLDAFVEKYID